MKNPKNYDREKSWPILSNAELDVNLVASVPSLSTLALWSFKQFNL